MSAYWTAILEASKKSILEELRIKLDELNSVRELLGASRVQVKRLTESEEYLLGRVKKAEAEVERLKTALVDAIKSPKDRDRMDEAIPCVMASYRARAEKAEAEVERLRGFAKWASKIRWASAAPNPILDEVNAAARATLANEED